MPRVKLAPGEALKLYGPMAVTLASGRLSVHEKIVEPGEKFIVHKTRNYVVVAVEPSEIDISMLDESQIQILDQNDPYLEKIKLVRDIVAKGARKIIVIGCTDCGKTSLTTITFNTMLANGLKPIVIDSDVGQADIGPPGFITMGSSNKQIYWLTELQPLEMKFIGDIKPQLYSQTIIYETKLLVEKALRSNYDAVVIDTDGWVRDEQGIQHKLMLIEKVKPDVVFVLGDELKGIFKQLVKIGVEVYELPTPIYRKARSREERRALRSLRYREFLEDASILKAKIDDVVILGHPLFLGSEVDKNTLTPIIDGRVIHARYYTGTLHVYGVVKSYNLEEARKHGFEKIKAYPIGFEKGFYCSVGVVNGPEYPGVIEKIDFENREIIIRTKYTGRVEVVKLGKFKLTENYTEEYIEVVQQ